MKFDIKDLLMMSSPMYLLMKLIKEGKEKPKETNVAANNAGGLSGTPSGTQNIAG